MSFPPLLHLIQCIKMPLRISQPGKLQSSIGPIGSRLIGLPGLPLVPPPPSGLPGLPTPPISAGLPKLVGLPLLPNRNFEAMGAQLISGAQQILMVLGAQGAREPRTMKCTKAYLATEYNSKFPVSPEVMQPASRRCCHKVIAFLENKKAFYFNAVTIISTAVDACD